MLTEIGKTLVIIGLGIAVLGGLLWVSSGSLKNLPIGRLFTLTKIMTKLPSTSATTMAIIFLVMNLSTLLREFLYLFFVKNLFKRFLINKNYSLSNY